MIRRPPRSTLDRSSAASDVYKRQGLAFGNIAGLSNMMVGPVMLGHFVASIIDFLIIAAVIYFGFKGLKLDRLDAVSYTHLRAHETVLDIVCRLLLEKKKHYIIKS